MDLPLNFGKRFIDIPWISMIQTHRWIWIDLTSSMNFMACLRCGMASHGPEMGYTMIWGVPEMGAQSSSISNGGILPNKNHPANLG